MIRTTLIVAALACLGGSAFAQPQPPTPPGQYMVLVYETSGDFAARSDARAPAYWSGWNAYTSDIAQNARIVGGGPLVAPTQTRSVRGYNGEAQTREGPFIRGPVQLSGYYLIEAASLDAASALAAKSPAIRSGGAMEIRPMAPAPAMALQ